MSCRNGPYCWFFSALPRWLQLNPRAVGRRTPPRLLMRLRLARPHPTQLLQRAQPRLVQVEMLGSAPAVLAPTIVDQAGKQIGQAELMRIIVDPVVRVRTEGQAARVRTIARVRTMPIIAVAQIKITVVAQTTLTIEAARTRTTVAGQTMPTTAGAPTRTTAVARTMPIIVEARITAAAQIARTIAVVAQPTGVSLLEAGPCP
jgi:hypothetical protein